jgi:hypothetical protein
MCRDIDVIQHSIPLFAQQLRPVVSHVAHFCSPVLSSNRPPGWNDVTDEQDPRRHLSLHFFTSSLSLTRSEQCPWPLPAPALSCRQLPCSASSFLAPAISVSLLPLPPAAVAASGGGGDGSDQTEMSCPHALCLASSPSKAPG